MSKYTPFSLFIRQALLYPLASPFLPAEADVKKDTSYANGALTGSYDPVVPVLEWQPDQNVLFDFYSALTYAEYLEADGVTVSECPQNIWRLPTAVEIGFALLNSYFEGDYYPSGFVENVIYWSSVIVYGSWAWSFVCSQGNNMYVNYNSLGLDQNVRCVKI